MDSKALIRGRRSWPVQQRCRVPTERPAVVLNSDTKPVDTFPLNVNCKKEGSQDLSSRDSHRFPNYFALLWLHVTRHRPTRSNAIYFFSPLIAAPALSSVPVRPPDIGNVAVGGQS
ncbi:hypothetical protein EYF80_027346 [Liparis tanakae]|uniref:Uncharacterized protein n=1 Tax=Liparis tanakae TaxID=230148 RepID=A0A4Z2H981_9TELE|nr:hypothetical protein EYF80_027346 [Liparis tanakae]